VCYFNNDCDSSRGKSDVDFGSSLDKKKLEKSDVDFSSSLDKKQHTTKLRIRWNNSIVCILRQTRVSVVPRQDSYEINNDDLSMKKIDYFYGIDTYFDRYIDYDVVMRKTDT